MSPLLSWNHCSGSKWDFISFFRKILAKHGPTAHPDISVQQWGKLCVKPPTTVHEVSHVQFHEDSCPRLCGGGNSQQDTDLLSNLQALLSHSRTGPDKPQSDDQMLLQSSLVTQAQHKKAGFDLWNALSQVVEVEAKRRNCRMPNGKPPNWLKQAKSVAKWHTTWRKLRCAGTCWSGWEAVRWSSRLANYSD